MAPRMAIARSRMWKLGKKNALVRLIGGIMGASRALTTVRFRTINEPGKQFSKGGKHGNRMVREKYSRIRPSALRRVERGSRRALVGGGVERHLRHHLRLDLPVGASR